MTLRAHEELYPDVAAQEKFIFFDEVQNAPGWETYLRRGGRLTCAGLHDTEDINLFVTGSSSHLLSRDITTGRRYSSTGVEVVKTWVTWQGRNKWTLS